jgi:hypothetical protein
MSACELDGAVNWDMKGMLSFRTCIHVCWRAVWLECTLRRMADDELPDELGDEFDEVELHFAAQCGDMTPRTTAARRRSVAEHVR